jgi:hypothetical protein
VTLIIISVTHRTAEYEASTAEYEYEEPPEIAQQTRTLTAAQAADAARDRSGRPSAKQIGSRATLDILEKRDRKAQAIEDRENMRSKYLRKYSDGALLE